MFDRIKAMAKVAIFGKDSITKSAIDAERKKISRKVGRIVRKKLEAHYDNATTTDENRRHWKEARENTPTTVNNRETRRRLRIRGRYEHDNNCYCSGMVSTYSKDVVGSLAPKLQISTNNLDFNSLVQQEWQDWSNNRHVNLTFKLKLLDSTKQVEGEGFFLFRSDDETRRETKYSLNPEVLSPARVQDPTALQGYFDESKSIYNDDGALIDIRTGRPIGFMVSNESSEVYGNINVFHRGMFVSSQYCHQWFTPTRPQQFRGVCEIQAALNKFAQLRRYSLATLMAAETAANLAGVMKTNLPVTDGPAVVKDYSNVELVRGMLVSLPEGWEATQFEPKQPISGYTDFINTELREIGRLLDIPRGIMLGDSSAYNYSSARLDFQGYDDRIAYLRQQLQIRILDPLFCEWFVEFLLVNLSNPDPTVVALIRSNIQFDEMGQPFIPKHSWQFTKRASIDPQKDSAASTERLKNLTSNLAIECAANGDNWEEILKTYSDIFKRIQELGLTNVFISGIMDKAGGSTPPANSGGNTPPSNPNASTNQNVTTGLNGSKISSK